MRRIRQVLQLHFGTHASTRTIAREVGVGRTTVQDYLTRAGAAGFGWPLPDELERGLAAISSSPSSNPNTSAFSAIRSRWTDFGIVVTPCCSVQRMAT